MAGAKGRSGGARPGAGRPPKEPAILVLASTYDDPLKFLKAVMNDSGSEAKLRVDAAKALMPFIHARIGETGKKAAKEDRAKGVSAYAPSAPPLKLVGAGK